MSGLVVGPPEDPLFAPAKPAPVPAVPWIPGHIEVVTGGRAVLHDTGGQDNSGQGYKIRPMDYVQCTIGAKVHGFEWPRYTWVMSHANDAIGERTEHVGDTVRFDKHGTATAWNRVTESTDFCGKGAFVQHERNARIMATVSDADAQDNGLRFCEDVIVAGSAERTDPERELGWTAYLRLRAGNALAYFSFGAILGAIRDTGVQVTSWARGGIRAFEAKGKWVVGVDLSQAQCQSAIRLAPGQRMTFEPTDQISWSWLDGRLRVQNGAVNVLEIDTTTGDIYKRGVKVL